jgi:hypothetical protein
VAEVPTVAIVKFDEKNPLLSDNIVALLKVEPIVSVIVTVAPATGLVYIP